MAINSLCIIISIWQIHFCRFFASHKIAILIPLPASLSDFFYDAHIFRNFMAAAAAVREVPLDLVGGGWWCLGFGGHFPAAPTAAAAAIFAWRICEIKKPLASFSAGVQSHHRFRFGIPPIAVVVAVVVGCG